MATCTFNATIDSTWTNTNNWTNGTPTSLDAAVIDATCLMEAVGGACVSVTVNAAKTLTIADGETLTVGATGVTVNGTLSGAGTIINAGPWTFGAGATSTYTGANSFVGTSAYNLDGQGKTLGAVTIDNNATLTATSAVKAATFVTVDASYYADGGFAHEVTGATLTIHASTTTFASTSVWTPSGNCSVSCNILAKPFATLNVTGTVILTADTYTKKVTGNGTIAPTTSQVLYMRPAAASWWGFTGTCTCLVDVYSLDNVAYTPGSTLNMTGGLYIAYGPAANATYTPGVNIPLGSGALRMSSTDNGYGLTLAMGAYSLTCGDVYIGHTAFVGDKFGILDLGTGNHVITGNITKGQATAVSGGIVFGSSTVTFSGTLTGTDIAGTNTSGVVIGGTINSLVVDNALLHLYPTAAGAGNTNVTELSPNIGDVLYLAPKPSEH